MRAIYKYTIRDNEPIKIPMIREFLSVKMLDGKIYLWVDVDPNSQPVNHIFQLIETGSKMDEEFSAAIDYIGTVQDGHFVWHVYYKN